MRILIIDNYDSFTYNLSHLVGVCTGSTPVVVPNDRITLDEVRSLAPEAIILSPGPGHPGNPRDFGVCGEILGQLRIPLLGVCLGFQGLAHSFGGRVRRAVEPMHGRASRIFHQGSGLFEGLPQGFLAVRYHSLVVEPDLPEGLELTAWTAERIPMGLRHRALPFWGVQFHPESIGTEYGDRLVGNFLRLATGRPVPIRPPESWTEPPPSARSPTGHGTRQPVGVLHRKLDVFVEPEDVFVALYANEPYAFWLDSSLVEAGLARHSYIGAAGGPHGCVVEYCTEGRRLTVRHGDRPEHHHTSIFDYLGTQIGRLACDPPDLPGEFTCGFVGYFGYELKAECGADAAHRSDLPDAQWLLADRVIAFDGLERSVVLMALCAKEDRADCDAWFRRTERSLQEIAPAPPVPVERGVVPTFRLRRDHETYLADIGACLDEIRAGESYQVCLTNRLETESVARPLDLYRILRRVSPAPHAAYLRFDATAVLCSSPEQFLKIGRDRWVTSKPIKGTAAREPDPARDGLARQHLGQNTKDRAENLMIVDLLRNDLGRVCELGSVCIPRLMDVETYATVHQLVSTVRGRLRLEFTALDCIRAAFPGGSMTGAPKIRTMEIIDRLEKAPRSIYAGCIGYLSLNGAADLNIAIRTAVVTPKGTSVGIGGAIVALSDPDAEFAETLLKARAIIRAILEWKGAGSIPGADVIGGVPRAKADPPRDGTDAPVDPDRR